MLEVIIALVGITLIYAYLYSKSDEKNIFFRILFLAMTLWSVYLLVWLGYHGSDTVTEVKRYNETGDLVATETWNNTLSEGVKGTILTYLDVTLYVPFIVIAIIMIVFIWNSFANIQKDTGSVFKT